MEPLAEQLEALAEGFDYLVIDTHPSGYLQELALRVAEVVIAPVRCEALAMDGVAATLQMASEIGRAQQVIIVPTMYDERLNAHRYNHRLLQQAYGAIVAPPVPNRVAVAEAHAEGKTIWEYNDRRGPAGSSMAKVRVAFAELVCWLTTTPEQVLFDDCTA
jgi:cellulose biosynthesis protein BcsQ